MLYLLPGQDSPGDPPGFGADGPTLYSPERQAFVVLVVDDNHAKRYAVSRALRAAGFHVTEAASAMDALARPECSAAVLDVHLPDMDGFALCRRMRDVHPRLPIVQISSVMVEKEYQDAGREAGADAYLTEPDTGQLVRALDRLLREKGGPLQ